MLRIKTVHTLTLSLASMILLQSCGGKKDDGRKGGGPMNGGGQQALTDVKADFSGAVGVLVIDPNQTTSSLRLIGGEDGPVNLSLAETGTSGDGSLAKVGSDGEVSSAISSGGEEDEKNNNGWCCKPKLPAVKTIAISPNKEIYLHFERSFVYKAPDDGDWSDAWEPSSGNMCQIFKVKGGTIEELIANPPADAGNLECLDNLHFVDTWQAQRNSVFQFDSESNVYYPGSLPNGNGKMVVYKRTADGKVTEMINSNICVQDFLVTKAGGIFYTGSSNCQNGGGGSGGGFFRYVSPGNSIIEIARDWWNFVFEPTASSTGDKAVFFGPDPTSSKTASWDSACLFNFDPTGGSSAADRIKPAITCGSDIWSWINMTRTADVAVYDTGYTNGNQNPSVAWINEFKSRCESSGQVFAGGGSQISAIKQTSTGEVYVIGQVRKKKEGELTCGLNVKGAHCVVKGIPYLYGDSTYGSKGLCEGASGTWTEDGYCSTSASNRADCITASGTWNYRDVNYNNVASSLCGATSGGGYIASSSFYSTPVLTSNSTIPAAIYTRGWMNCQVKSTDGSTNNYNWTDEYKGLAKVNSTTKTLSLLSGTDEQAINLWLVGDQPYFSSYNTTTGKYYLKKYENSAAVTVAENFEAYNLSASGETGKLYYDGLDFGTNAYSFGTMLEAAPYTRTIKTGLTGTVKTIVILSP
ncbi:MAG TPA: hypothetical protein VFO10_05680 [Oligoflexus sp.]|uniref:hypothetical protein n=1 Tax=Oligoflexus sp. TaxID=1971216 RepID=UPI002D7E6097|nr:hypothetical protein [Oligoflexus sp.]HET9236717.1 hypothetical protein [Oligoflexus sp.]